ncbi:hypothetical protein FRC06_010851 [Ceratobasidium sp. 370]|nr:hypothetical protein FRC06_010851 [Ceratobasidium sp. 370]
MDNPALPGVLITAALSAGLYSWYKSRQSVPLPPGPKGHLIFGNALDIANASAFWLKFAEYADQHGPIISIRMLHQHSFIISDPSIAVELFEKRAANYSDKPEIEMAKLIGWDKDILFLQYGPMLKRYRTMLNRALNNRVAPDYILLQQHEVQRFMKRLIEKPSEFMDHVRLLAASIAVRIGYGYKVESFNDRFVQTAEKHMAGFSECIQPWGWAVNIFPPLRYLPQWLPIAPFQRRALEARHTFSTHCEEPFAYVQDRMAAGVAEDSFTSKLLYSEDGTPVDDETKEHIKARSIAATLYAAGSDTTVSAVQSFFLAMTLYPEVQAKAQAEISTYLQSRLISDGARTMILPADRPDLPYTSALVRELLRWHPIVPMVGHRSSHQDDNNVVSGGKTYRIPARSSVIVNVWKIMHNPDVYEEPERFMPERYLAANPSPDPEAYAFGFGRSNLLANFMVTKAKDQNGVEITPQERYSGGLISHPLPFACSITPKDGCKEWLQEILE